ncbi:DUF5723 family protein [Balneolales bacterium ANBcel1]|nr:DUF5723 family protein [Balneolales bacterium ANBcel1]
MPVLFAGVAAGQPITSPEQVALGGGVAYVTGPSVQFYNPANLMIRDCHRSTRISLGLGGIYHSDGHDYESLDRFFREAETVFFSGTLPAGREPGGDDLDHLFAGDEFYRHTIRYDFIPVVVSWHRGESARSVALRSRGFSSFEINRNWFDVSDAREQEVFTRQLREQYMVLHELSYSFSREVTMFNRWHAGLNSLFVGIAPKIIVGGLHSETDFRSDYTDMGGRWFSERHLDSRTSGDLSAFLSDVMSQGDPQRSFDRFLSSRSNFDLNGAGLGLDAGLTYIIPLGDDIALSPHVNRPPRKSLRFAISITDLGAVRYFQDAAEWRSKSDTDITGSLPEARFLHTGSPGSIIDYLMSDDEEQRVLDKMEQQEADSYTIQLPTELHVGSAIQLNRIAAMLNFNYRFNSTSFEPDGWYASAGSEIRLLPFLPLRGSIQMNPDRDLSFGVGAGIDVGILHVSASARFFSRDNGEVDWLADTVSALGLQVRF